MKMPLLPQLLAKLRSCTSGNALILVAGGLPALVGGAGFATDIAQWYMWKRELQFAVDQAALAGAWARTSTATQPDFTNRAVQEFNANLSLTRDYASTPSVTLANYAAGTNNSVTVGASVTRRLPFSSFLTGKATTVSAYAQAAFDQGRSYTSCLIATDEETSGAITINGSSVLTARCGLASLSNSDSSITVNGTPNVDVGWVISRGGIDDYFKTIEDTTVLEYLDGLYDPFAGLTPPNPLESQTNRVYSCVKGARTTRAYVKNDATTTYAYFKGTSPTSTDLEPTKFGNEKKTLTVTGTPTLTIVSETSVDGVTTRTTVVWTQVAGTVGSKNATWERATTVTTTTQSGTNTVVQPDLATTLPGTYVGGINIQCQTTFAPGVYIIDGGSLDINAQYQVTGSGVMFVLKNGADIKINGGANINLTAIQASDLVARGVPLDQANKLAGMLVFEDRNSSGSTGNRINGNAQTVLNGTIYLPKSNIDFAGTASVTSQCLMVAAKTIKITGTANMTTFCPAGQTNTTEVAVVISKVKLVV